MEDLDLNTARYYMPFQPFQNTHETFTTVYL